MSTHLFTSHDFRARCEWCGQLLLHAGKESPCPLTDQMRDAIRAYAEKHGGYWKHGLKLEWKKLSATTELRHARHILGAQGLTRISKLLFEGEVKQ